MKNLKTFLDNAITPYHTVQFIREKLQNASFKSAKEESLKSGGAYYFETANASIAAFRLPKNYSEKSAFRLLSGHTDFPALRLTPNPDKYTKEQHLLHPEIYGSPILSTWFDRDLHLAGMLIGDSLSPTLFNDSALCKIPNLAIHLNKNKDNSSIDTQQNLDVIATFKTNASQYLQEKYIPQNEKLLSYDAWLVDSSLANISEEGYISSGRLDNLLSCAAALNALIKTESHSEMVTGFFLFNHEEIGSNSREGANGNFAYRTLKNIHESLGGKNPEEAFSRSFLISLDAAHAEPPNYSGVIEENHAPQLGNGIVLKTNAKKRYATDVYSEAFLKKIISNSKINLQHFVNRNDIPAGSTLGPILSANLGIPTVDIGVPLLSMHSIRETAHYKDYTDLEEISKALFRSELHWIK